MRRLFVGIILSAFLTAPALACGFSINGTSAPHIPTLAAVLDDILPNSKLSDAELKNIKALRAQITELAADNKMQQARVVEEQAMKILGYRKVWLHCGRGTFGWMKFSPKTADFAPGDS